MGAFMNDRNPPNGSIEVARVLLDHGANVNARTDNGQTPLDFLLPRVREAKTAKARALAGLSQSLVSRGAKTGAQLGRGR
jgi:ankyrin repeat protein